MSRLAALARLADREARTIVGLMSGTSLDGIDAALCRVWGSGAATRVELLGFLTRPYAPPLRERLEAVMAGGEGDSEAICTLNFRLGEELAAAVAAVCEAAGVPLDAVDLVASHGQTIYHVDPAHGAEPSTLQIGEGAVIAERTGRPVICDFRPRDMAAGGCGAPLVAYVDQCLFAGRGAPVALQNIGGIANVTVVTPQPAQVIAFDTGPGNLLIDEVCRELTCDEEAFDRDGAYSSLGEVDRPLLEELLDHPYLALPPPKTTGREQFGAELSRGLVERYDRERLIDLLATVVRFTAASIARSYRDFVLPQVAAAGAGPLREAVVSGGGAHNLTLMRFLREELAADGVAVRTFDELGLGFTADAKEAVAFAILANETVQGRPSNLPAATGASRPVVLGKIVL